jgi:hypothetical protein
MPSKETPDGKKHLWFSFYAWAVGPPKFNGINGPDPVTSFMGP